jgi:hypothetical protein
MADPAQVDDLVHTSPEGLREQALAQIKKRRDFHGRAFAFVAVNLVLWGVWSSSCGGPWSGSRRATGIRGRCG